MERIDLVHVYGKTRHQRWRHGWALGPYVTHIEVGELADGRWYVECTGRGATRRDTREGACVYAGPRAEHYARGTARRRMRTIGGEWVDA